MGGFSEQPYIYEPQRTVFPYSGFNPRAATQAQQKQQQARDRPLKKQDGPLINFNAHPDSYMVVAGQNVRYKEMPARTKKQVTIIRWVQFSLRVHELIAALGLLVCVICITDVPTALSWITRIAPAWDTVILLYAVYHLIRNAKARTPGSSASYHMFALFMDVGLIPFYIFIAMFANKNWGEKPGTEGRWTSFFKVPGATTTLLFVTFLASATIAVFHLLSAIFDLWLIVLFRKISKLPPDMNPLEDNLTSRRASKHKHKNSELTLTNSSIGEKKPGYLSGSTVSVDQRSRLSTANKEDAPDERQVPFQHSRMGSEATFSPHNPDSARWSRQHFEDVNLHQESARSPYVNTQSFSRPQSQRGTFLDYDNIPPPTSDRFNSMRPSSHPASRSGMDLAPPKRYSSPALPNAAPSNALVKSQQKDGLLTDNWVSIEDDASDLGTPEHRRAQAPAVNIERHDFADPQPQPLRMNPPTPTRTPEYPDPDDEDQTLRVRAKRLALADRRDKGNGNGNGNLSVQRMDTKASSVYSESAPSLKSSKVNNGTPKGKYYGDLAAATVGVRGMKSNETMKSHGTVEAANFDSLGMLALGDYGYTAPSPPPQMMKSPRKAHNAGGGRVVSRTGVDITDPQAAYPSIRGRDVSGKVAEEGRGGGSWWSGNGY